LKVYLNTTKRKGDPRKLVEVKLVKDYITTMMVELPDGSVIRRRKSRDLPGGDK